MTPRDLVPFGGTRRRGISLLEIVLSVALGTLLLGAIYSAMDQSARQTNLGRAELERLQIVRAVFRRIELDVRATMFNPDTAVSDGSAAVADGSTDDGGAGSNNAGTGTASNNGSSSSGSSSSSSSSSTSSGDSEWTGSLGIRGTGTELWIDLSHIRRELQITETPTATSDLQTVAYFLTSSSLAFDDEAGSTSITDADGVGLARSQGDRSVLRELNSSSSSSTLPGPMQVLAPEINSLKFRYFDGLSWYEQWDSSTSGSLPRAVEVVIGFSAATSDGGSGASTFSNDPAAANPGSSATYRMVIAIPASDPLPEEEV